MLNALEVLALGRHVQRRRPPRCIPLLLPPELPLVLPRRFGRRLAVCSWRPKLLGRPILANGLEGCWGLGFEVSGFGCRDWDLGFGVWGVGFELKS